MSFACTEPPDICVWRCVGHISASDLREMYDVQSHFSEGKRYIFALVDLTELGIVPAETRKAVVEPRDVMPVRGTAIFGATFHFRVIAQAVTTAVRLLYKLNDNPVRFFGTEAQARRWLDERRAMLLKESSQPIHP